MSEFGSNNSKYNDMNELKWTVLTKEEDIDDIDDNFYEHQKRLSFWPNSSPYIQTVAKNFVQEFSFPSSLMSDSELSVNLDTFNLTLINGINVTDLLSENKQNSTFEIYYFYQVRSFILINIT